MRPQKPISKEDKKALLHLLNHTRNKSDFQRIQCVWIRCEFGFDSTVTGKIVGFSPESVRRIWSKYLKNGNTSLIEAKRGGRRRSYLSLEEEREFLEPLKKNIINGSLSIKEFHLLFEEKIGKVVPKSTIYRLLQRNGLKRNKTYDIAINTQHNHNNLVFF